MEASGQGSINPLSFNSGFFDLTDGRDLPRFLDMQEVFTEDWTATGYLMQKNIVLPSFVSRNCGGDVRFAKQFDVDDDYPKESCKANHYILRCRRRNCLPGFPRWQRQSRSEILRKGRQRAFGKRRGATSNDWNNVSFIGSGLSCLRGYHDLLQTDFPSFIHILNFSLANGSINVDQKLGKGKIIIIRDGRA